MAADERLPDHIPKPSPSQIKAVAEVIRDLTRGDRKRKTKTNTTATTTVRVVMGDVGTGKTLVAAAAIRFCTEKLHQQAAVMAPTEALAKQLHSNLVNRYGCDGGTTELLRGATSSKQSRETLERVRQGTTRTLVGTTGITAATFADLKLLVIDEQQKFGVEARNTISERHEGIVIVMMTATPIPRTLRLMQTAKAIVRTSRIEHDKGSGREGIGKPTVKVITGNTKEQQQQIYADLGRRARHRKRYKAYLVYASVTQNAQGKLTPLKEAIPDVVQGIHEGGQFDAEMIAVLHGRMDRDTQNAEMERFRNGRSRILMASSIIEVGIHDEDATDIVIHNAERFGAAQLHQIMGRVGRNTESAKRARCILLTTNANSPAILAVSSKQNRAGHDVAQADLDNRGCGDLSGTTQKGNLATTAAAAEGRSRRKTTNNKQ